MQRRSYTRAYKVPGHSAHTCREGPWAYHTHVQRKSLGIYRTHVQWRSLGIAQTCAENLDSVDIEDDSTPSIGTFDNQCGHAPNSKASPGICWRYVMIFDYIGTQGTLLIWQGGHHYRHQLFRNCSMTNKWRFLKSRITLWDYICVLWLPHSWRSLISVYHYWVPP